MPDARKSRFSRKLILGFIAASAMAADPLLAGTLPTAGKFAAGAGNISTVGSNMTINQSARYGIINWKGFSIGAGNKVMFNNGAGATLNRVTGVNISHIDGMLGATGAVYLINPNGVVIGPGGKVLTNGDFIASTRDVSNQNFLQGGSLTFSGTSGGTVVNEGKIVSTGGAVILIGQAVVNSGSVSAANGTVGLAAGNSVLLQPVGGDQRVFVQTGAGNVSNSGQIKAAEAELRAAGGNVFALAGNTGGLIQATGSKVINGQVWLTSNTGSVSVSGTVQAQNMDGSGGKVVATGNAVTVSAGAEIHADATSGIGGNVVIRAAGTAAMDGTLSATGQTLGGHVETSGRQVVLGSTAQVATTASAGPTGSWLIDPQNYTIASSGGDITGSQLSTELASSSITILSSQGATSGTGDINVNDAVSWSANTTLTLSASHNVNVNDNITATGNSAGLVLTPDTGGGGGNFNLKTGAVITLSGSTPRLSIAGTSYTVVNSAAALQAIGSSGDYALGSNINVASITNFSPIGGSTGFSGTLNGLGNTVSNLTINLPSISNVGLIGTLNTGGAVENIGVSSGSVTGLVSVGGLVGSNEGTITDSYANVVVAGNSGLGGLVANNNGGTISGSYASGSVTASGSNNNYAGGLAGGNNSGTITDSYATGSVSGGSEVGGLVGQSNAAISNSYATGSATGATGGVNTGGLIGLNTSTVTGSYSIGTVSGGQSVGGLAGGNSGTISASFSSSIVTGGSSLGGLVGSNGTSSNAAGTITDSYATGSVTAGGTGDNYVGGLAGGNYYGSINNSYAIGAVSGGSEVGGLIGQNNGTVINTYATGSVTGAAGGAGNVGGLVGLNTSSVSESYSTGAISGSTAYGGFAGGNSGAITDGYYDSTTFSGSGVGSNTGTGSATGLTTSILESALPTGLSTSNWANANNTTAPYLLESSTVYAMAGNIVAMLIFTPSQLEAINNNLSGNYALGGNIDLSSIANFTPIGGSSGFSGTLNGLGYTVSNLTINQPTTTTVGFISTLNAGATLENIGVVNGNVSGESLVGVLTGVNDGSITNCFTTGTLTDNNPIQSSASNINFGGLVGQNAGTVSYSSSSVNVVTIAGWNVGGLVGGNTDSITNSYATGNVSGLESVGGLAGASDAGSQVQIINCYATGTVSGQSGGTNIGGLIGFNNFTVSDSYAIGQWKPQANSNAVGGLIGYNSGTVSYSYAAGSFTGAVGTSGTNYGELIGQNASGGTATDDYANTTAYSTVVGSGALSGANGVALNAMMSSSSFSGFNFTGTAGAGGNNWVIVDLDGSLNNAGGSTGGTLPMLASEYSTAITNAHQLQLMDMAPTATYVLADNINASNTSTATSSGQSDVWGTSGFVPIGDGTAITGYSSTSGFSGTFNGNGHYISNLTIDNTVNYGLGLFSSVVSGGTIENVGLLGGSITGSHDTGGLIGDLTSGTVNDTYSSATVDSTGGSVGGLVGLNAGTISNSYTTGNITGGNGATGGVVGRNGNTANGSISDVYATGAVTGASGTASSGSYDVGAVVGWNFSGTITDGYWNSRTMATGVGYNQSSAVSGGGGLTDTGMMTQSSFVGFNFSPGATWTIYSGNTTPLLNAFLTPLTITAANIQQSYNAQGSTATLSGPSYSVADAPSSGDVLGLSSPYAGDTNVGTYAPVIWSNQQGYNITVTGGSLSINPAVINLTGTRVYDANIDANASIFSAITGVNGQTLTLSGAGVLASQNAGSENLASLGTLTLGNGTGLASNYTLVTGTDSVSVTPVIINLAGTRVYDANTDADAAIFSAITGLGTQTLTLSGTGSLAGENAGNQSVSSLGTLALGNGTGLAANYTLIGGTDTVNITPATLTETATAANSTYGASISSVTGTISGFLGSDTESGVTTGTLSFFTTATTNSNVGHYAIDGTGLTVNNGDYTIVQAPSNAAAYTVNQAIFNLTGTRAYDANSSANGSIFSTSTGLNNQTLTISGAGTLSGENVGNQTLSSPGTLALGNGTGLASNYTLIGGTDTVNITPALLYVTGTTATGRAYNGLTAVSLSGATLAGTIYGSDSITLGNDTTGTLANANAGTESVITAMTLSGNTLGNYALVQPSAITASITPATLTAVSLSGTPTKAYDGTTTATLNATDFTFSGFVSGQTATVNVIGSYASANANTGIGVSATLDSSDFTGNAQTNLNNYTLPNHVLLTGTGTITPAPISITLTGDPTKPYDGTADATLASGDFTLSGFAPNQSATVVQTVGLYNSPNVTSANSVTASLTGEIVAASGTTLSNYEFPGSVTGAGAITPLPVSAVITGNPTKVYDSTANAALTSGDFSLAGFILGQGATISSVTGTYASTNVGQGIQVTATLTGGNFAGTGSTNLTNYTLPTSAAGEGAITPAPVSITINGTPSKVYDGTTNATLVTSNFTLTGFVSSQLATVSVNTVGTYNSPNVTTANTITTILATGDITASGGTLLSNYTLPTNTILTSAGAITPAPVTLSATRRYDAGVDANASLFGTVNGVDGQTLGISGSGTLASENVGAENVNLGTLTLVNGAGNNGGLASNYSLGTASVNVTPATLTMTANALGTIYGSAIPATSGTISGFVGSDNVSNATTGTLTFSTSATSASNVGYYAIDGSGLTADNGNYNIVQAADNLTALNITPKTLTFAVTNDPTKVYDGNINTTLTTAGSNPTLSVTGFVAGQGATVTAAGWYNSPNVVDANTVTTSLAPGDFQSNTGTLLSNYRIPINTTESGLGAITPATISATLTGNPTKTYDGTATANLNTSDFTFTGFAPGEGAQINANTTGTYSSVNVAVDIPVSGTLTSGDLSLNSNTLASNYTIPSSIAFSGYGTIDAAELLLSYNADPISREYGSANPTLTGTVSGFVGSDTLSSTTTGTLTFTTTATIGSPVGTYPIVGSGLTLDSGNANDYVLVQAPGNATAFTVTPAPLNISIIGATKVYDGTTYAALTPADFSITGFKNSDNATASATGYFYNSPNVLQANTVSTTLTAADFTFTSGVASNYTLPINILLTGPGTITPAPVTISGTRVYDANTDAQAGIFGVNGLINTGVAGQNLTVTGGAGTISSENAGSEALISTANLTLANGTGINGGLASNYALSGGSVNVTPATLTVTATAANGTYGASLPALSGTISGLVGSDTLANATNNDTAFTTTAASLSPVGQYPVDDLGLTANNGNYTIVQAPSNATALNISPAIVTVDISTTKSYDGTTQATLTPGDFTFSGFVSGQGASVVATGVYNNPNVVGATTVTTALSLANFTPTGSTVLSNYTLPINTLLTGTGTITPASVTAAITGNPTKAYDTTANATLTAGDFTLTGFAPGQIATVLPVTGAYSSPNAATNITVNATLGASDFTFANGTLASNYIMPAAAAGPGTINPLPISVTITGNPTKIFDGGTLATLAPGEYSLAGFIGGQGATISQTVGVYGNANVGQDINVTASLPAGDFIANSGTLLSNYTLPVTTTGPGAITPKPVTVALTGDPIKPYDGNTLAALTTSDFTFTGFVGGDGASVIATGTYNSADVPTATTVSTTLTASDLTATGSTNFANYILPTGVIISGAGAITADPVTVTVSASRLYNGTSIATLTPSNFSISGFIAGQGASITQSSGSFNTADVDTATTVTTTLSAGDFAANNGTNLADYTLPTGSISGVGTINPVTLTYVATSATRPYFTANPSFSGTVTGFVDGQNQSSATTGSLSFSSPATSASNAGHYAIDGSGLTAIQGDYTFVQAPANATALTITPLDLTVNTTISTTTTRVYNGSTTVTLPSSDFTLSGFVNGNQATVSGIGTFLNSSGTATADVPTAVSVSATLDTADLAAVGGTGINLVNYVLLPVNVTGTGTITPDPINISGTRVYDAAGDAASTIFGSNGIVPTGIGSQTVAVTGLGTLAGENRGNEAVASFGTLAFTSGGTGLAADYSLNGGTVNITPATLTVTATPATTLYNTAIPSLSGTITGFLGSDTLANATNNNTIFTTTAFQGSNAGTYPVDDYSLTANYGNYNIVQAASNATDLSITPLTLTISSALHESPTKLYDGNTNSNLTTGDFLVTGFISGQGANINALGTYNSKDVLAATSVTVTLTPGDFTGITGTDLSNYSIPSSVVVSGPGTITASPVSFSGTRVYDNNTDANYSIFGTGGTINTGIGSETLVLSGSASTSSANASGLAQTISPTGLTLNNGTGLATDYTFVGGTDTVLITPLQLTITGLVANDKNYNANTTATLSNDGSLVGILGGQSLTLNAPSNVNFSQSNVGSSLTVTASGYTLANGTSGTTGLASNYSLTGINATATTTADINPATINLSGTRIYDANTDANASIFSAITGVNGQTLTLSGAGTLVSENVGNENVSALGTLALGNGTGSASNYTLVGGTDTVNVTPATLTETATAANSTYGSSISSVTGTITGFVGSDTESNATSGASSLVFSTPATSTSNVGHYAIDGSGLTANNGNYNIVQAVSNATAYSINKYVISLSGTRIYDANTDANASIFAAITGVSGQTLTLSGSGSVASKNVGNENLSSLGTLALVSGSGLAGNYTLIGGTDTVNITAATLTETATLTARSYGSAIPALTGTITGFVGSDTESNATSGASSLVFSTPATSTSNVGHYAIDGSGLTADNGNYNIVQAVSNATAYTVNPAIISLSGTRIYDANTDANAGIFGAIYGVSGQTLILSGAATLSSANASSTAQSFSPTGLTLSSGSGTASNYTLVGGTDTVLITPLQLTITGLVANDKNYNANTTATLSNDGSLVGILGGQSLTLNAPSNVNFSQSNVGSSLTVTASGYTLANGTSGTTGLASNYSLTGINATATTTADINPAVINLSGTRIYDANTDANASIFSAITGVNGQTLTLSGAGTLVSENVGNENVSALGTLALGNGTGSASNYTLIGGTDTVNVTPATLTETATAANSTYGSSISSVTGTITGFVGSDTESNATSGASSLVFSTPATSTSNAGTYAIDGSGLTADNGNYNIVQAASNTTAYTVNPAIISLSGTRIYDANTDANASIFSAITGVNGQTLTLSGAGTLVSENVGNENVSALGTLALGNGTGSASNYTLVGGTDTVNVTPATLTETATAANSTYGSSISSVTGTITGFVGSDTESNATSGASSLVFSTPATSTSNVGTYAIDGSGLTADNGNYNIVQAASNATAYTVNPAIISLSGTRIYDANTDANASIFSAITGVNGQTLTLSGAGTLVSENVGNENVSALGTLALGNGTGSASNYTLIGGTDTVNITPAPLTETATAANSTYGSSISSVTGTITGFVGSDTESNATSGASSLVFSTPATSTSNVGTYAIDGSGLTADNGNYNIVQAASNATAYTVNPAIISLSGTRIYNANTDANASIFSAITGVNGQTLTLSGAGTLVSENVGNENVSALGTLALGNGTGLASNYTLIGGTDTVNVTPATLTETATAANSTYGSSISSVTGTITGFVGSDTESNATSGASSLVFSTPATSTSNVGTYAIDGSGLTADNGNYNIVQAASNATAYTVNPAIISLSGTRIYDANTDANASIFSAITGVNGQTLTLSGAGTLVSENVGNENVSALGTLALGNGTGSASNYTLIGGTDTVNITPAPLTETATAANSTYGSSISSVTGTITGFVGSDTESNATSGASSLVFSTPATSTSNVGTYAIDGSGLTADNGNYNIVQAASNATAYTVNPAIISLSGTRIYNANTDANASIFSAITGVNGQTLTLSGAGTLVSENVGNENVSALGTLALGNGTGSASNYTLIGGTDTVNITPAPLSLTGVTIANNKVYDTTTAATLDTASSSLSGVFGSDAGNVSISGGTGIFSSPNVGNAIPVTAAGFTLVGAAAHNYFIAAASYPTGLMANITPAPLIVVGSTTANNKIYDGTTTATLNTLNDSLRGILGSDSVSISGAKGAFVTPSVGNNISVNVTSFILSGTSAANYAIISMMPTGLTANIMPSPILINFGVAGYWYTPSTAIITDSSGMSAILPPQPINEVAPGMAIGIQNALWKKPSDGNQFAVYADILGVPTLVYATDCPDGAAVSGSMFKTRLAANPLHTKSMLGLRIGRRAKNHNQ